MDFIDFLLIAVLVFVGSQVIIHLVQKNRAGGG